MQKQYTITKITYFEIILAIHCHKKYSPETKSNSKVKKTSNNKKLVLSTTDKISDGLALVTGWLQKQKQSDLNLYDSFWPAKSE